MSSNNKQDSADLLNVEKFIAFSIVSCILYYVLTDQGFYFLISITLNSIELISNNLNIYYN